MRLFARARASEDRSWVELIDASLLAREARGQRLDGRPSRRRSGEQALRAAALWREHARRTGAQASLDRAGSALDRAQTTTSRRVRIEATLERARLALLDLGLRGGADRARRMAQALDAARLAEPAGPAAEALALRAEALGVTDDGVADLGARMGSLAQRLRDAGLDEDAAELILDQTAMTLAAGLRRADAELLERAGRDLSALVRDASPDHRPITRARALLLCAVGLAALGRLARSGDAELKASEMFSAAADQFTPDHSPLDWAAIELARQADVADASPGRLAVLTQAEALTAGEGLILGALARERRAAVSIAVAGSDAGKLLRLEALTRRRVRTIDAREAPLDWAADQISLVRICLRAGRLAGRRPASGLALAVIEAAAVAREHGAPALADRAERLLAEVTVDA